jgi:hypothetical protein
MEDAQPGEAVHVTRTPPRHRSLLDTEAISESADGDVRHRRHERTKVSTIDPITNALFRHVVEGICRNRHDK